MKTTTISAQQIHIEPYQDKFKEQMVDVWERSARGTHYFVSDEDMYYFKSLVQTIDFGSFPVYCLVDRDKVFGFIGVADGSIETLFLDPDIIGKGFGTKLMRLALDELKGDKVDVNEQNHHAVRFYSKFGFTVYDRTEKSPEGKDYPILRMKLDQR